VDHCRASAVRLAGRPASRSRLGRSQIAIGLASAPSPRGWPLAVVASGPAHDSQPPWSAPAPSVLRGMKAAAPLTVTVEISSSGAGLDVIEAGAAGQI